MSKERDASDNLHWKAILLSNDVDEVLPDMEKLEALRVKLNEKKTETEKEEKLP